MKLAQALVVLALVATASGLYLGHRDPPGAKPELRSPAEVRSKKLSTEVVRLRRELAAMKAQIAVLQDDAAKPAPEPRRSGSESSDE